MSPGGSGRAVCIEFGVLGPVVIRREGRSWPVGSGRDRFVLAMLLLRADRVTPSDLLIDALWAKPPATARAQLHNIVSKLRRRLRDAGAQELIVTRPLGYELRLGTHRLDVVEFRRLVARGQRAIEESDHALGVDVLGEALECWRGPALADVSGDAHGLRQGLADERLDATQARLEAQLACGRYDAALAGLPDLIAEYPHSERLVETQMVALVGAGRLADALAAYRDTYRRFVDELGVEPGKRLRALERRILRGDRPAVPVVPGVPAVALRVIPRQLPPASGALTGRETLVREICRVLRQDPSADPGAAAVVAVLVGASGVGKTALAVTSAHRVAASYPDGQLYADLRGSRNDAADPAVILGQFLRALGVPGTQVPDDRDERTAMYRSLVAGGRTLVVLDDAASEEQVRPLLPATAGCGALVASRRKLGGLVDASRWTVPVLAPDDAVELVGRIVGPHRVADERAAAASIVAMCGLLPLAVCVAAARLAVHVDWPLKELQERLTAERGRLDELAVGDMDVRASIALSYQMLDPDLRRLFRLLGQVTAGTFPAWVAGALMNASDPVGRRVGALLDSLADAHLVEEVGRDIVGQPRYRMHDLVSQLARERLLAEDDRRESTAALTRVLAGWLALATEADGSVGHGILAPSGLAAPQPPRGAAAAVRAAPLDWLEIERPGLVTAIEQACDLGDGETAGALALRLCGFLTVRAYDDDRERILRAAIACLPPERHALLRVQLLHELFAAFAQRNRYADLPALVAEQIDVARRLPDPQWMRGAQVQAGWLAREVGRLTEAVTHFEAAATLAAGTDDEGRDRVQARGQLGWVYVEMGDAARGSPLMAEAVASTRAGGRNRLTALWLVSYAESLIDLGQFDDAERAVVEAQEILREIRDDLGLGHCALILAVLDIQRGQLTRAAGHLAHARPALDRHASGDGDPHLLRVDGELAAAQGRWVEAVTLLRHAVDGLHRLGRPLQAARALARLQHAQRQVGDEPAAAQSLSEYRAILTELRLDDSCLRLGTR